jgi:hypothetical protein
MMISDELTDQACCDVCHQLNRLDDLRTVVVYTDKLYRLRQIEQAAVRWFEAHRSAVADCRDCQSPLGEPGAALRRLAELLAA